MDMFMYVQVDRGDRLSFVRERVFRCLVFVWQRFKQFRETNAKRKMKF